MGFREDEEAIRARLAAAETTLEAARRELEATRREAAEAAPIRFRIEALQREVSQMPNAGRVEARRWKRIAASLGILGLVGIVSLVVEVRASRAEVRAAAEREHELRSSIEPRARALAEGPVVRAEAARLEERPETIRETTRLPATGDLTASAESRFDAVVVDPGEARGVRDGTTCTVALTLEHDGSCRGEATCGEARFPTRRGLLCERDVEGHVVRASGEEAVGRRFDLDTTSGSVRLSSPEGSLVRLELAGAG